MDPKIVLWFRQDLRLEDNPALRQAAEQGHVIPIYILDDKTPGPFKMGAASRVWLHHSLESLNRSLNNTLSVYKGTPAEILPQVLERTGARSVYWNRCYEPWRVVRDQHLKTTLKNSGIQCQSFNGSLLFEPWDVLKKDQTPYRVFTPFFQKGCLAAGAPRLPLSAPENPSYVRDGTLCIHDLGLLPAYPWHKGLEQSWTIGEAGAKERLKEFLEIGLNGYKEGRNFPEKPKVSRLSPHLHFGEISPNQVWYAAQGSGCNETDLGHFLSELGWREFSNHLLYHTPSLPEKNLQNKFDQFPWKEDPVALKRWQEGQTGYPIVDAGLRELWQTGYMHNRVRMIVASFLVKNLLIHWTHGAQWFWDCLVDADLANNSASWQWVAGCGADAAPYFRIFNPITQAEKFDPQGAYIRRFVPELEKLHTPYLFAPWTAPQSILNKAGVILGQTYPAPIVQVDTSRKRALDAFSALKNESL